MRTVIVIPARLGSTRFPAKPMALICGKSLLERVWRLARAVDGVDDVLVATDDTSIARHAESFGATAVMTPVHCANGSERVFAAVADRLPRADIVVNLQGDAALTPPWIIQAVVAEMRANPDVSIATPATQLDSVRYAALLTAKAAGQSSGTTVVFNRQRDALYFSKLVLPHQRDRSAETPPVFHHIGLYAYRYAALERYVGLAPTPLERAEQLEQLRALEHGMPIRVVPVDYRGRSHWSVDTPADVGIVEEIIRREGELT